MFQKFTFIMIMKSPNILLFLFLNLNIKSQFCLI